MRPAKDRRVSRYRRSSRRAASSATPPNRRRGVDASNFALHDFVPAHLPELVDLWVASWNATLPAIDFEARRGWLVDHLASLQDQGTEIVCALDARTGLMAGFVTIDAASGHIDQLAVARQFWGAGAAVMLLDEARRRSAAPVWLEVNQDNPRAVRFYEKQGFQRDGESVNERSGLKTWRYRWPARPHQWELAPG